MLTDSRFLKLAQAYLLKLIEQLKGLQTANWSKAFERSLVNGTS